MTINPKSITARSKDGLKITIDLAVHYKVGTNFENMTSLFWEYSEIYARYGEPLKNWKNIIDKVTIASVNNAF